MKTIAVTSVLSIVAVGCATTYRPQKPGVISYVLDGPGFSLYKNGEEYGASGLSSAPIRAVAGNPLAEEHARIFVRRSRIAWTLLGIAVASLAAGLALNPNGRNQFMDGCSATSTAQGIDGAQVNHDLGSLKPCAYRNRSRACPT